MTELTVDDATEVAPTPGAALEQAPEVVTGEIVTDAEYRQAVSRSRLRTALPALWQDPDARREAGRELAVRAVRGPLVDYPTAVLRGAAVTGRVWRDWVTVAEVKAAAKEAGRLADKWEAIRAVALLRWKITGAGAAVTTVGASVLEFGLVSPPAPALWGAGALASGLLALVGRRKDGSPGRKAILPGPRGLAWTMNGDALVDAFRSAGIVKKDEGLAFVARPSRRGDGWAVILDLPPGRKASQAIVKREDLATALAVDEVQLVLERVRGKGGHAGRLSMWVADSDPYDQAPVPSPLCDLASFDFWQPFPFGIDARGAVYELALLWSSLLVGGKPRMGKSFSMRLAVAAAVLDPFVQLYVFCGKGAPDWKPLAAVAHRHALGQSPQVVEQVRDTLAELVAEADARQRRLREFPPELVPEGKLTPAIARDPSVGIPLTVVVIDEVQNYVTHPTYGKEVSANLENLVKSGPSVGIITILGTQKPTANSLPTGIRDNVGTRFALKVTTREASEAVLGGGTAAEGLRADQLSTRHKGVGILYGADGESALSDEAATLRTHFMDLTALTEICDRGRELRIQAGTLTGDAAGDPVTGPVLDAEVVDPLPQLLRQVVDYLADDLDDDGRPFVPTAELLAELGLAGDRAATQFGRSMGSWGCRPTRGWIPDDTAEGGRRQVRGYPTADIRAVVARIEAGGPVVVLAEAA